jgi:CheY-like chemotaxis protein
MLEIGFADYLCKPFRKSSLLHSLVDTIAGSKTGRELESQNPKMAEILFSSKLKILLAEDSPINQKVAINQLNSLGLKLDVVANGQEALDLLEKIPYDIILMDCQMPILDGYSASRQIREREAQMGYLSKRIVIIAITANAMSEDRERCFDSGMDDFLSKPVRKEDLAKKLYYWNQILTEQPLEETVPILDNSLANIEPTVPEESLCEAESIVEIDWHYLEEICSGNAEFKQELLQAYVSNMHEHLESLAIAISNQQYVDIEHEAHFIKGSSTAIGINGVAKIASLLEVSSKSKNIPENASILIEKMAKDVKHIQTETQ